MLKAPAHTAELPNLVETFPGVVVVHLHRDIVETVASGASLFATFRSTYSDQVDAADVGRFQAEQTERWLRRALDFRSHPTGDAATFLDVALNDLVRDPVATVERVYEATGMEPPADPTAFVEAFNAAQPRHAHGTHHYDAAAFGLVEGQLREQFAFLDDWPSS